MTPLSDIQDFIAAWDTQTDDENLSTFDTHRHTKVHDAILETGVRRVIGLSTYEVFNALHRYIWRSDRVGLPQAIQARRNGKVVAVCRQSKLAELSGLHRRQLNTHIQRLKKLGWVKVHLVKSDCIYELGFLAIDPTKGVVTKTATEVLYKDEWEKEFYSMMESWAVEKRGMRLRDVSMEDRVRFCEAAIGGLG